MREVRQREKLVAFETEISREVVVVLLLVDVLWLIASVADVVLLAEVDHEDAVVVELAKDGVLTLVGDLLAQGQLRTAQGEKLGALNIVLSAVHQCVMDLLQLGIQVVRDLDLGGQSEVNRVLVGLGRVTVGVHMQGDALIWSHDFGERALLAGHERGTASQDLPLTRSEHPSGGHLQQRFREHHFFQIFN